MGTLPKCLRRQELLYNAGATQQGCQQMALGEADASALTENFAGFAGHFAALDIPGVGDGIPYPLKRALAWSTSFFRLVVSSSALLRMAGASESMTGVGCRKSERSPDSGFILVKMVMASA
jgi:hypothetical protein